MATTPAAACKIISHSGGGLYVVEVQYDDTVRTERIAEIDKQLLDPIFIAELARLKTAWDDAVALRNAWLNFLNGKILDYQNAIISKIQADIDTTAKLLRDATTEGLKSRNTMILANLSYHQLKAKNKALEVERLALFRAGNPALPLIEVWCIDLSDGLNGRAIYANNTFAPLLCLNYAAGKADGTYKYLLPPKNVIPLAYGGTGGVFEVMPQGVYNRMDKYSPHDAAGFTFWNGAMEPGFAKWKPILLHGKIVANHRCDPAPPTNGTRKLDVSFPYSNVSRFGTDLAHGTFSLRVLYFDNDVTFKDGDDVVCAVTISITGQKQRIVTGTVNGGSYSIPQQQLVDVVTVTGYIIGYYSNPKVRSTSQTAYSASLSYADYGSNFGDYTGIVITSESKPDGKRHLDKQDGPPCYGYANQPSVTIMLRTLTSTVSAMEFTAIGVTTGTSKPPIPWSSQYSASKATMTGYSWISNDGTGFYEGDGTLCGAAPPDTLWSGGGGVSTCIADLPGIGSRVVYQRSFGSNIYSSSGGDTLMRLSHIQYTDDQNYVLSWQYYTSILLNPVETPDGSITWDLRTITRTVVETISSGGCTITSDITTESTASYGWGVEADYKISNQGVNSWQADWPIVTTYPYHAVHLRVST